MNAIRVFTLLCLALAVRCGRSLPHDAQDAGRSPRISPDYSAVTLPPNIAPLNFRIIEDGDRFLVKISSSQGKPIVVASRDGAIGIPMKKWRALISENQGNPLIVAVFARKGRGSWRRYAPIKNRIAREPIDPYITYRSLSFLYNYSSDLSIHERHLESFREKTLLSTKNFYWGCVNCHTPDGRFILFCMHAYGPYPVTQPTSDLYLLDLETGAYRRLEASSDESESWHGWSKNGRWIVVSSKRNGGIFTRVYLAHIDSGGGTAKPFILPQKDPRFYESYIRCFNVPELAIAAAPFTERDLIEAIRSPKAIQAPLPQQKAVPEIDVKPSGDSWPHLKIDAE